MALFSEELGALPGVLRLGHATRRTIHLNIAAAVLTKVTMLPAHNRIRAMCFG